MKKLDDNRDDCVSNPCVRQCCLSRIDVCLGCGRTLQEITDWHQASNSEKLRILERARQRLKEGNAGF